MEVADRQQLGFTIGKPFSCGSTLAFRAMPIRQLLNAITR
jgi:hypothetical protein